MSHGGQFHCRTVRTECTECTVLCPTPFSGSARPCCSAGALVAAAPPRAHLALVPSLLG